MKIFNYGIQEKMEKELVWSLTNILYDKDQVTLFTTTSKEVVWIGKKYPAQKSYYPKNDYGIKYLRMLSNCSSAYIDGGVYLTSVTIDEEWDNEKCSNLVKEVVGEMVDEEVVIDDMGFISIEGKQVAGVSKFSIIEGKTAMVIGINVKVDYSRADKIIQPRLRTNNLYSDESTHLAAYLESLPSKEDVNNKILARLTDNFTSYKVDSKKISQADQQEAQKLAEVLYKNEDWLKYGILNISTCTN